MIPCQSRGWRKQRKIVQRWAKKSAHLEIVMCDVWQSEINYSLTGWTGFVVQSFLRVQKLLEESFHEKTWFHGVPFGGVCLVRKPFTDCYRARKSLKYPQVIYSIKSIEIPIYNKKKHGKITPEIRNPPGVFRACAASAKCSKPKALAKSASKGSGITCTVTPGPWIRPWIRGSGDFWMGNPLGNPLGNL